MGKYFLESDFKAFDSSLARKTDDKVIANRLYVVNKLRALDEQGLKSYMLKNDLHSHKQKAHLTSVVWPLRQANGEYVDYVRMGYGKSKEHVIELAKILQMYSINNKGFMKYDMAFHYVTQLQLSINEKGWNIALYLGYYGWLQQKKLVNKLFENSSRREEFKNLLDYIIDNNYVLYLCSDVGDNYYEDTDEYINDIIDYFHKGISFTIYIANEQDKESKENETNRILNFLIDEFDKLMPLYKFISWDPTQNNYIK